jgi:hypothetical protein
VRLPYGSLLVTWRAPIGSGDVAVHPDWLLHRGLGQVRASVSCSNPRRTSTEEKEKARERKRGRETEEGQERPGQLWRIGCSRCSLL